jgi:hypothetical protein
MLNITGYIFLLLGSQMYQRYFKHYELFKLTAMGWFIGIAMAPFTYALIFRWNLEWGISDTTLMLFDDAISEVASQAFIFLPMTVLYAKITPPHIEATCFAFLASASNFSGIFGGVVGAKINEWFVGVTQEDLSGYWKLVTIGYVCSTFPLIFRYWLLPTNADIERLQKSMNEVQKTNDVEPEETKKTK